MGAVIPKILHQFWIGPLPRPAAWMGEWRDRHPGWRYELWDDARCAAYPFERRAQIDAAPEYAGKVDIMRYEILWKFGGVYVDADCECLAPLDESLLLADSFAAYEHETLSPGRIWNGVLGATAGNRLMRLLIDALPARDVLAARAWITTGPEFLSEVVRQERYDALVLLPSHQFLPEHFSGAKNPGPGKVYARHHWGSLREVYEARPPIEEAYARTPAGFALGPMNEASAHRFWGTSHFHVPRALLPNSWGFSHMVIGVAATDDRVLQGTFTHRGRSQPLLTDYCALSEPWTTPELDFKFSIDAADRPIRLSWWLANRAAPAVSAQNTLGAMGQEAIFALSGATALRIAQASLPFSESFTALMLGIAAVDDRPLDGSISAAGRTQLLSGYYQEVEQPWPRIRADFDFQIDCGSDRRLKIAWWPKAFF